MEIKKNRYWQNELFRRTAKRFSVRVRRNEYIESSEINSSWEEIEQQLANSDSIKKKKRYAIQLFSSVAAAFLLIISFSVFYLSSLPDKAMITALDNYKITADSTHEISLITADSRIKLEDKSMLDYDKDGSFMVNNQQVAAKEQVARQELNHIIVPRGKRMNITFSDGTKMYVNAGSHVIYPTLFDKEKREIAVDGEVFLEVAHNPKWPFYVKTSNFDVKVLGTSFNISAYKTNELANVVLVEGRVEIENKNKEIVKLLPDQIARITRNGTKTENVNVLKYICWKDNMMILEDDKVGIVLHNLARYYGVDIRFDKRVADIPISGKLDLRENIRDVLDIIGRSVSIRCEEKENSVFYLSVK